MAQFELAGKGQFIIRDYQNIRPFSSFLPGIAGEMGIPLWAFYVNRGQAIASFGVENKDKPILEYQTANRAYQLSSSLGFRTLFRIPRAGKYISFEPFKPGSSRQEMRISANELYLKDVNRFHGLQTEVVFFILPGEDFPALVRIVTVSNKAMRPISFEVLDGLSTVTPFGVTNQILKEIGRTVEAWMEVHNVDGKIPFYRLSASVADTTEVGSFEAGHFMLAFRKVEGENNLLPIIVDPTLVFGQDTSYQFPLAFHQMGLIGLLNSKQITCGRTPCGFSAMHVELGPSESMQLNSLYGHIDRPDRLQSKIGKLMSGTYLDEKRHEANDLVRHLTDTISCQTSSQVFDEYCRQTFLDNVLRGGVPVIFGKTGKTKVYHIFSRKHGDLERDYNAFSFSSEYYSQGNGSYRDVNQNRREDVWFNPAVNDFNIRFFVNLIQADGYNPLTIQGNLFKLSKNEVRGLLPYSLQPEKLKKLLTRSFSPGGLLKGIKEQSITLTIDLQQFLESVVGKSEQFINASPGEGYWIDHWTYNLDLIEEFFRIYPDRQYEILFLARDFVFYDSPWIVQPRLRKYILIDGHPRQYGSLIKDPQKARLIEARRDNPNRLRAGKGTGGVYRTNLFVKLFMLVLIKFATLDPWGMGVEMEAGRPGWDDALNGLPGLFGSSMPETYALKRMVRLLRESLPAVGLGTLKLPVEVTLLLRRILRELQAYQSAVNDERDFRYWDRVSSAREKYRLAIRLGLNGKEEKIAITEVERILGLLESKLDKGISRANQLNNGIPPTYFTFSVKEFERLKGPKGEQKKDSLGHPLIRVRSFMPKPLPLFLEGMVGAMRISDKSSAMALYEKIKAGPLFDRKLKMYKLNAPLGEMPADIGRVRAFTPGWLENESIWLHMEYKYLLEILRAGLYEQFFDDIKNVMIPFLDPQVYGRSPLENSSFLVSSAHPDVRLHGAGFVARLSGASAEFLSIWTRMMAGENPFYIEEGRLCLSFKPILPAWLFTKEGAVSFRFLGHTKVVYHNPKRRDTYLLSVMIKKIQLHFANGEILDIDSDVIPSPLAQQVRNGLVDQIDVYIS